MVSCRLQAYGGDRGGVVSFDLSKAKALAKRAPSGVVPNKGKQSSRPLTLASGFPHIFHNTEDLQWGVAACLRRSRINTLEFPILENGRDYDAHKKPRPDAGPCRIVYSELDSTFCGVMCHKIRYPEMLKKLSDPLKEFTICR
jgi:hypothetical protein